MICTICLDEVRETRSARRLPCNHLFHGRCIHQWECRNVSLTCPTCRNGEAPTFKATLIIHNTRTGETMEHLVAEERTVNFLNSIEFTFESNSLDELHEVFGL